MVSFAGNPSLVPHWAKLGNRFMDTLDADTVSEDDLRRSETCSLSIPAGCAAGGTGDGDTVPSSDLEKTVGSRKSMISSGPDIGRNSRFWEGEGRRTNSRL